MMSCNYEQFGRKKNELKPEQPNHLQQGVTKEGVEASTHVENRDIYEYTHTYTEKYS